MNFNKKRHQILKALANSSIEMEPENLGVNFVEIYKTLNINESEFKKIAARLYNEQEIKYTNVDVEGVYSTSKGLESYIDKKYLREYQNRIITLSKDISQITIPILSLVVAIIVLSLKLEFFTSKLENSISLEYKAEIKNLNTQIDSLKNLKIKMTN